MQTKIGGPFGRVKRLPLHLGNRFETGAGVGEINLPDERFRDPMVVVEAEPGTTGTAVHGLRAEDISFTPQNVSARERGVDFYPGIGRFVANFQLLAEEFAGPFEIIAVKGTISQASQRDTATTGVPGFLRNDIGIPQ